MTKKELAARIAARLKTEYEVAECTLDYTNGWQLLVAVRLAAQCTDARVNVVTAELFSLYPTPAALAGADAADIEKIVHPCGLGNTKARDIKLCMTELCAKYGGLVPETMEELLALPGVGRKSANLIIGDIWKKPAVVTDTHCIRLCRRFGLTDESVPAKVERELRALIDPAESNDFCHRLVLHGRAVCTARRPDCGRCALCELCEQRI